MRNNSKFTEVIINIISLLILIVMVYPFLHSLLLSLSPQGYTMSKGFGMIKDFGLSSWKQIVSSGYMWKGFYNSILRTVVGSIISIFLQITIAYPLSKKRFIGYKFFNLLIVLSTILSAGIIPNYILVKNLHIMNTIWALVLPGAISGFNVIVLKNFYEGIPTQIEEAAIIDGANDITIFFKIIFHISLPAISTIALWTIVGNWNAWFDAVLYINNREKMLLPAILREIVMDQADTSFTTVDTGTVPPNSESLKAAATMFVTVPILLVYPYMQRFFVSGITVGAVKG